MLCLPAKLCGGFAGIGIAYGDVAGAARAQLVGHGHAVGTFKSIHNIEHRIADAGAEVVDGQAAAVLVFLHGFKVAVGQVDHMDIVAHTGAVGGGVVAAEHRQLCQFAAGHLAHIGQ